MTPEERAAAIAPPTNSLNAEIYLQIVEAIEAAEQAARESEREACAKIAHGYKCHSGEALNVAMQIGNLIRARGKP